MAYTTLTVNQTTRAGLDLGGDAAVSQIAMPNPDEKSLLMVKNAGATSINVTIATPITIDGQAVPDPIVAVGAGATKLIGPFPKSVYNQPDGTVHFDLSGVSSVTVLALKCGSVAY